MDRQSAYEDGGEVIFKHAVIQGIQAIVPHRRAVFAIGKEHTTSLRNIAVQQQFQSSDSESAATPTVCLLLPNQVGPIEQPGMFR